MYRLRKYKFIFLLALLILFFFWKVLVHPTYILYSSTSDIITQEMFWNYFSQTNFQKSGELPLWNPYTFGGRPFIGFFATSFFNLLDLPFLFFPIEPLFGYLFILYYFLAALSMYFFLRLIELDEFSSFTGAIVYAFSGRLVGYVYNGHATIYSTVIAVPLALIFLELLIRTNKYLYAILAGAVLALQLYGAHVQYFFFNLFFLLAYFLYRVFILAKEKQSKSAFKLVLPFLLMYAIAFLLSAAQLLPFLEITQYSTRANIGYEYAGKNSLPPWHLVTLIFPNFFGSVLNDTYWGNYHYFGLYAYIGVLPLALAALSFFKRNKYASFFIGFAVFSLLYALGKYFFVHHLFYNLVPGFNLFRSPERMLFFFNFSMAVLSGFGASFLLKQNTKKIRSILKVLTFIAIATLIGIVMFYFLKSVVLSMGKELLIQKYAYSKVIDVLKPLDYYIGNLTTVYNGMLKSFIVFAFLLILVILLLSLFVNGKIAKGHLKTGIVLVILIDLFYFGLPYIDVKNPKDIFVKNDVIAFLEKDKSTYRVLDLTIEMAVPQQLAVRYDIQELLGYDAIILKRFNEYVSNMGGFEPGIGTIIPIKKIDYPKMLDLLNIKYVVSDKSIEYKEFELVFKDGFNVYLNRNFLPRAFIVHELAIKKSNDALEELKNLDFDPKKYVILEERPERLIESGAFKEAEIIYYSPNKIVVKTNTESAGFLVLSENWYPGWKAFDNGKETKIYIADYIFRAVYLDKGSHNVEFIFNPKTYRIGMLITIFTVIFVLMCILFFHFLNKNKKSYFKE